MTSTRSHSSVALAAACVFGMGCGASQSSGTKTVTVEVPAPTTVTAPKDIIQKVNTEYMKGLLSCAQGVLKKDASAAGTYVLHFHVQIDGAVQTLAVLGPSPELQSCVKDNADTWTFEPRLDEAGTPQTADYQVPLAFKPATNAKPTAGTGMMEKINNDYMAGVHACHNAAVKKDPKAGGGNVKLRFEVKADGTIGTAEASGIDNQALLACIKAKLQSWELPPPTDSNGQPTTHTFGITVLLGGN